MLKIFPYAGSSAKVATLMTEIMNREGFDIYAEPLIGSGAMYFHLMPERAFLCDIEPLITNVYRVLQDDVVGFTAFVSSIPPTKEWFDDKVKTVREIESNTKRAAVWYSLLYLCYNGVVKYRDNEPRMNFGDRYLVWDMTLGRRVRHFNTASRLLNGAQIYDGGYEVCPCADIAFFDPPWFNSLAQYLSEYRGKWLLTINDCAEACVYKGEWVYELNPYYSVAPVARGRGDRAELLIANFKPKMFS